LKLGGTGKILLDGPASKINQADVIHDLMEYANLHDKGFIKVIDPLK
jgi:hypothetical protein